MTRRVQIALVITAAFFALVGLFLTPGARQGIHATSLTLIYPLRWIGDQVAQAWEKMTGGFVRLNELERINRELQRENAALSLRNSQLEPLAEENRRLTELLRFRQESSFELVASRVIGRDLSTWSNRILIDFGYGNPAWPEDLVLHDTSLPVVTARGVVGRTLVIGERQTEVILLTDEGCEISATAGGRARGIVRGMTAVSGGRPRCRMSFIPVDEEIGLGQLVTTSGLGGTFPPGLNLGIVIEAPPPSNAINFGLYREVVLQPSVDLEQLREVFVIVGARRK